MTVPPPSPIDRPTARAVNWAAFGSGALIAQQVAGKAARDALFLSSYDVSRLPIASAVASILGIASVIGLARIFTRRSPARVVPALFLLNAALRIGEWVLAITVPWAAALALYAHSAIFGAVTISGFWSLVNERFDPRTARLVVGRIAGGGTAGGVLGGLIAWQVANRVAPASVLLLLAMTGLFAAVATYQLARSLRSGDTGVRRPGEDADVRPHATGFALLRRAKYLQSLALLITLGAIGSAVLDYLLSAGAAARYHDSAALLSFFALFYMGVGLATFVVQSTIGQWVMARFGLATPVAAAPSAPLLSAVLFILLPAPIGLVLLRAPEAVLRNSLFRAGYELFYTPLPKDDKRSTKTIIDVGFDRIGTAIGGGLTLLVLMLPLETHDTALLALALFASIGALLLTPRLQRGYIAALGQSLRSGVLQLAPDKAHDAVTRRTLSESAEGIDRTALLAQIDAMRRTASPSEPQKPAADSDARLAAIGSLIARDPVKVRRVLATSKLDIGLVAEVLPLLGDRTFLNEATLALRAIAPKITGQLTDALLDTNRPRDVRRRIPRILRAAPTQRSLDGLLHALEDPDFLVRYECGLSLLRIVEKNPDLSIPETTVLAAVAREIEAGRTVWDSGLFTPNEDDDDAPRSLRIPDISPDRSLEHVFSLLSLALEREPLRIAYRVIATGNKELHGTALEYLENVLPGPIRDGLWPYLGEGRPAPRETPRTSADVAKELLTSGASLPLVRIPIVPNKAPT